MNNVSVVLVCVAVLLAVAVLAVLIRGRSSLATNVIYSACFVVCGVILATACAQLLDGSALASEIHLPIGLPWIGARFRIDFLSSFFLIVINLGGALASLYALGYGRHEE